MSYNGIGLSSAKGSSTSGYVQQSLALNNKKRDRHAERSKTYQTNELRPVVQDESVLAHKVKREVELLVSEYRDKLEDSQDDLSEDVIDEKCDIYRKSLIAKGTSPDTRTEESQ
ncbi:unnamed protein product [Kluyveromyces dobzhanskii CBS 2104]|uniref:Pre-mRNA-splicing factor CWC21 n=1 Tax=Kluyveromyces dobzhanskii CBS 2104 TaxID=1427455 RepID=A0A0A8L5B2_9SACH|nr:unnamed protein product [Kluyveromyces dobzhanskii CBS 2104]